MKIKFFLLALATLISATNVSAELYKILFINTPTIKIGKKNMKVGDVFDDSLPIKWASDKQAVKVQNMSDHKMRLIVSSQYANSKNLREFFSKTNHMSTRGDDEYLYINEMAEIMSNRFSLLDSISFSMFLDVDSNHYFTMSYQTSGETIEHKLVFEEDKMLITRNMFGGIAPSKDITVTIKYIDMEQKTQEVITDSMVINLIPLSL